MSEVKKLYFWKDINQVPNLTGIYAWYYQHTLTEKDIKDLLQKLATTIDVQARVELVKDFLEEFLFSVFVESPYEIIMRAKLKPLYRGEAAHVSSASSSLLQRLAAQPERLWTIKRILDGAVPEFASPVYIGMAKNLRTRLMKHKELILEFKANQPRDSTATDPTAEDVADHSFAQDVVRRGFLIHKLTASIRLIDDDTNSQVDAENILNRINFPLCGRN